MSILIKGMEMPKGQHTVTITICHDGYAVVEFRDRDDYPAKIEAYQAVPVPEHGRLIDADALMDALPDDFLIPSAAAKVIERTIIPASVTDINVGSKSADREEQIDGK